MTRFYKGLWLVFITIFALSCSDDDESLPLPTADFALDQAVVEVGVPVLFDNRSLNAARYEWVVGEGSDPITDISPSITFETPGTVTVTLTAFTQDEQSISTSQDITVRQRALRALFVNNFPVLNSTGTTWDPDEAGVDSLADVIIALRPEGSQDAERLLLTPLVNNAQAPLFFTLNSQGDSFILTDETWDLSVEDFDGDDLNNATGDDFELMVGFGFNPVDAPTIKSDDGMSGIISIVIPIGDPPNQQLLDIDLTFELE